MQVMGVYQILPCISHGKSKIKMDPKKSFYRRLLYTTISAKRISRFDKCLGRIDESILLPAHRVFFFFSIRCNNNAIDLT